VLSLFQSPLGFLTEIARMTRRCPKDCLNEWIWIEPRCIGTLRPIAQANRLAFQEGRIRQQDQPAELH